MSKFVKDILTQHVRDRLAGVEAAILVSLTGLDANKNSRLRRDLRAKQMSLMVVKNSVARRATEGTALATAFEGLEGSTAVVWGGEDIVSLAKEVARIAGEKQYDKVFTPRGGVLDGARLTADEVKEVSKWPSRMEMLSILAGQILAPGARLASQLTSAGGALASQIEKKAGEGEPASEGEAAPEGAIATEPAG